MSTIPEVASPPKTSKGFPLLNSPVGFLLLALFLLLGEWLGISQISPTINYNYMNGSLLYVAAGLLFAYAAGLSRQRVGFPGRPEESNSDTSGKQLVANSWLLLLAGFCIGFDFFVKFSSSVLFFGFAALFLLIQQTDTPFRRRLRPLIILGLGYITGMAAFFLFICPFYEWLVMFQDSLHAQTGGTHNPFRVINKQIGDFRRIGTNLIVFYALPLTGLYFLSRKYLGNPASRWWLILPASLLLNALLAYKLYPISNFRSHTLFYIAAMLIFLVANLGIHQGRLFSSPSRNITLLLLLLLPFLLIFGSDASFSYAAPLYLLPWFGLLFMLIHKLPSRAMRISSLIALILLAEVQFVTGYLYFPWRWVENRLAQTEAVQGVRGLAGIQVDKPTHTFITQTRAIVSQIPAENRRWMIGFYEMPGVVYWLDGSSPGLPWYSHHKQEQIPICNALKEANQTIPLSTALLLIQEEPLPKLQPCLNELDITLDHYRAIGQAGNPYAKKPVTFYIRKEASPHAP